MPASSSGRRQPSSWHSGWGRGRLAWHLPLAAGRVTGDMGAIASGASALDIRCRQTPQPGQYDQPSISTGVTQRSSRQCACQGAVVQLALELTAAAKACSNLQAQPTKRAMAMRQGHEQVGREKPVCQSNSVRPGRIWASRLWLRAQPVPSSIRSAAEQRPGPPGPSVRQYHHWHLHDGQHGAGGAIAVRMKNAASSTWPLRYLREHRGDGDEHQDAPAEGEAKPNTAGKIGHAGQQRHRQVGPASRVAVGRECSARREVAAVGQIMCPCLSTV